MAGIFIRCGLLGFVRWAKSLRVTFTRVPCGSSTNLLILKESGEIDTSTCCNIVFQPGSKLLSFKAAVAATDDYSRWSFAVRHSKVEQFHFRFPFKFEISMVQTCSQPVGNRIRIDLSDYRLSKTVFIFTEGLGENTDAGVDHRYIYIVYSYTMYIYGVDLLLSVYSHLGLNEHMTITTAHSSFECQRQFHASSRLFRPSAV
jgi:hypothetical protein